MLHDAMGIVVEYCHQHLLDDKEILEYALNVRQLTMETIEEWKLGSFPTDPQKLFELYTKLKPYDEVLKKELFTFLQYDGAYFTSKFFTNRFLIPIADQYGRYIAITGRTTLDPEAQSKNSVMKYYNTPYPKTHNLFGLNKCLPTAIKVNELILVEGNIDVLTAYQHHVRNIVAYCNATVSQHQLAVAARYVDNIIIIADSDEAGRMAKKTLQQKLPIPASELGVKFDFLELKAYKDVDEYLRKTVRKW